MTYPPVPLPIEYPLLSGHNVLNALRSAEEEVSRRMHAESSFMARLSEAPNAAAIANMDTNSRGMRA